MCGRGEAAVGAIQLTGKHRRYAVGVPFGQSFTFTGPQQPRFVQSFKSTTVQVIEKFSFLHILEEVRVNYVVLLSYVVS